MGRSRGRLIGGVTVALLWLCPMVAGDSRVANSNLYMDTILQKRMPAYSRYESLDPATLDQFVVATSIKNWSGHKFKANFSENTVTGLGDGVTRLNDCSPVGIHSGNITVGCNIQFRGVHVTLDGFGHGDTTVKKTHRVTATAILGNSFALVEIAGPEQRKPGLLVRFAFGRMNVTVTLEDNIKLGSDRALEFNMNVKRELTTRLDTLIKEKYVPLLSKAISTVDLPPL